MLISFTNLKAILSNLSFISNLSKISFMDKNSLFYRIPFSAQFLLLLRKLNNNK
jgi:hypothetical protein